MAGLLAPTTNDDFIPDAPSAGVDDFVPDDDFAPDSEIVPATPGAIPLAAKGIVQGGLEMARTVAGPVMEAGGQALADAASGIAGMALGRAGADIEKLAGSYPGPSTVNGQFVPSSDRAGLGEQLMAPAQQIAAQTPNPMEGQTQFINRAMKPIMESPSLKLPPELQQAEYGQLYQQGDWSNFFKKAIMDTAQMTPQLAGAAAAGAMTGGSAIAAPIAAGALGALQEGGSFYEQAINEGMDPQEALARSGAFGAMVGTLNAIPFTGIGGKVVARTPFVSRMIGTRTGNLAATGVDAAMEAATETAEGGAQALALEDIETLQSIPTDPMAIKKVVDDMAMGAYGESGVALPAALSSLLMSAVTRGRASGSRRVMDRAQNKPAPEVQPDPSIITGDQAPPVMSDEEARATPVQPPVVPVETQTGQTQPDIPLGPEVTPEAPVEAPAPRPADIALKARAAEVLQSIAPDVAPTPEVAAKPKRARKPKPVAAPVEEQGTGGTTALPWSITPEEDAQFLNKEKSRPSDEAPDEYRNKWMVRKLESQIEQVNQISAQAEAKIADWSARVYKSNDGLIEKKDMYGEEAGQQTLTSVNERRRSRVINGARSVIADNNKLLKTLEKDLENVKSRFPEPEAPAKPFDQAASDAEMLKLLLDEKPTQSTVLDLEGDPSLIPGEDVVEPEIVTPAPAEDPYKDSPYIAVPETTSYVPGPDNPNMQAIYAVDRAAFHALSGVPESLRPDAQRALYEAINVWQPNKKETNPQSSTFNWTDEDRLAARAGAAMFGRQNGQRFDASGEDAIRSIAREIFVEQARLEGLDPDGILGPMSGLTEGAKEKRLRAARDIAESITAKFDAQFQKQMASIMDSPLALPPAQPAPETPSAVVEEAGAPTIQDSRTVPPAEVQPTGINVPMPKHSAPWDYAPREYGEMLGDLRARGLVTEYGSGEIYVREEALPGLVSYNPNIVLSVEDTFGWSESFLAKDFAELSKAPYFNEHIKQVRLGRNRERPTTKVGERFMGIEGKRWNDAISGKAPLFSDTEDVGADPGVSGVTLSSKASVLPEAKKAYNNAIADPLVSAAMSKYGIKSVTIQPPRAMGMAQFGNIDIKERSIELSSDLATEGRVRQVILHEIGHVEYESIDDISRTRWEKEIFPKIKGRLKTDDSWLTRVDQDPKEGFAETFALQSEAWAQDALRAAGVDIGTKSLPQSQQPSLPAPTDKKSLTVPQPTVTTTTEGAPVGKQPWQMTKDEFLDEEKMEKTFSRQYRGKSSATTPSVIPNPQESVSAQPAPVAPQAVSWPANEGVRSVVGTRPDGRLEVAQENFANTVLIKPEELQAEIDRDTRNYERRQAIQAKQREDAAAQEAAKAQRQNTYGFAESLPGIQGKRAVSILDKQMLVNGEQTTRKAAIENRVNAGATVVKKGNERRLQYPGDTNGPGSFLDEKQLSKTAMDYAEYLVGQRGQDVPETDFGNISNPSDSSVLQGSPPHPTVTTTTEGAPQGFRVERIELPGDPALEEFRSRYRKAGIRAPKGQSIEDFGLGTDKSLIFRKNKGVAADIAIQDAAGLGLLPHDANLEDLATLFRGPAKKVVFRHVPIIHAPEGTAEWFSEMTQEKERLWREIDKSEQGGRKTTKKADALRKELDMLDKMEADAIEKHGPISVLGDVGAEIREQAKEATTKKARGKKPKHTDPRQVGGVYHSDYWNKDYTVLDIKRTPSGAMESIRVQWSDGTVSASTTQWDKRDRVVSAPPAQAQAQVLLSPEAQSIVDAYGSTEKALAALEHQRETKKQEGGSTTQADRIIKEIRESKQTDLFGQETITGGAPDRGPGGILDDQTTLPMGQAAPQGDAGFDWEAGKFRNAIDDDEMEFLFGGLGIVGKKPSGKREKAKLNDSPADLHVDPNRDPKRTAKNQRMTAEPLSKTFKEKADKFLGELKRRSTRAQEFISNDKSNATTNEMFRLLKANSSRVGTEIGSTLSAILEPLGPNQQKFFQHYLFMKNMQENIKNGGGSPRNGYYSPEQVEAEVERMENILRSEPTMKPVIKAIAQRQAVKQEMTEKLQNLGLLPEDTDKEWYWHQQVSSMHELRRIASTNRPNPKKRSFQKARSQSDLRDDKYDINEDYLQSEFEWMFEAGIEIEKELWLRELNKRVGINFKDLKAQAKEIRDEARARVKAEIADIKAQAKLDSKGAGKEMRDQIKKEAAADAAQAREDGIERVRWTDLIPEGYRIWQPSNRSVFKPSHSPVGRFVDNLVEQMQQAEGEEAQKMDAKLIDLTEGSRVFVLPDAVVDQLNKMESKEFSHFRELEQNILRLWKARTLFAPDRIAGYFFRNGLGDYDAMVAGAPGISKKLFSPSTWKEAIDYQKGDTKMSRDWQTAISLGVVDSGQHTVELVSLDELPFFKRFAEDGDSGKGMMGKAFQAYWNSAIGANAVRENAFRYAAFKYYKEHLTNKTLKSYGGSNPEVVDAIAKEMGVDHAAAHLARNLSGDYSNLTEYGEWLRQNLFPFWAFTEINSARTARIFRNTANEGARMGDYLVVGKDGKPIDEAGLGEKASRAVARSLYWGLAMGRIAKVFALTYMFNHLLFPDEEDDLSEEAQNSMHLVLGRRQDGSVRYYSNVGAIATAMDSVGVQQMVGLGMQYANDQLDVQSLLKGLAVATPKAVTNLGVQQLRPDFKAVPEALMGQSSYPDIFNMRAQDSTETLLKVIGGDRMAAWAQGKPLPNFGERLALGTLAKQPAQEAMIDAYRYRDRYLKKIGKSREGIFASDENLRTMRQAVLANDREAFARYKAKYLADGKKYDNFKASVTRLDPLTGIPREDRREFWDYLTEEQATRFNEARRHARDIERTMRIWWRESN